MHRTDVTAGPSTLVDRLAARRRDLDVEELADSLAAATVVGLAPTTREAQEVARLQAELLLALVERGSDLVILQDTTAVGERLDAWVSGDDGERLEDIQADMWGPWRIAPVTTAMRRLRELRRARPDRGIRVAGISRASATTADYPPVLAATEGTPEHAAITHLLDTIVVAHDGGEHVERAHGRWNGPPFVDLARDARSLARSALAGQPRVWADVGDRLDRIVDFHAHSISQGHDSAEDERRAAERLLEQVGNGDRRAVVWDGIGHLAGDTPAFGNTLRRRLAGDYRCVMTVAGSGRIRDFELPVPRPDSLDAVIGTASGASSPSMFPAGAPIPVTGRPVRIISGRYDPDHDAEHYAAFADAGVAFDDVVHLPSVTPARPMDH